MMFVFIASEAFFFLTLIISFVYYSRTNGQISGTSKHLDIIKTGIFSLFLFSSSLTVEFADKKLKKGKKSSMLFWLYVTIALGLTFIVGQGIEYTGLIKENITVNKDIFSSAFYTLTGFHGLHVIFGLIALSIFIYIVKSDSYDEVVYDAFNTTTIYWHFVDGVWVVVFLIVYLGSLIEVI